MTPSSLRSFTRRRSLRTKHHHLPSIELRRSITVRILAIRRTMKRIQLRNLEQLRISRLIAVVRVRWHSRFAFIMRLTNVHRVASYPKSAATTLTSS
jgi:uncharacterized FlgJ-related protein